MTGGGVIPAELEGKTVPNSAKCSSVNCQCQCRRCVYCVLLSFIQSLTVIHSITVLFVYYQRQELSVSAAQFGNHI